MTVLRRTWLATLLLLLASTAVWWKVAGWEATWGHVLPTLLVAPPIWWVVVGRQPMPRLWRGIVGGGLAGFVTQSAQDIPDVLSALAHRGTGTGEGGLAAGAALFVLLVIAVVATFGGALLGLTALLIERSGARKPASSV